MPLHSVEGLPDPATDEQARCEGGPLAVAARLARVLRSFRPVPVRLGSLVELGSLATVRRWDLSAGRTWRADGIPTMGS